MTRFCHSIQKFARRIKVKQICWRRLADDQCHFQLSTGSMGYSDLIWVVQDSLMACGKISSASDRGHLARGPGETPTKWMREWNPAGATYHSQWKALMTFYDFQFLCVNQTANTIISSFCQAVFLLCLLGLSNIFDRLASECYMVNSKVIYLYTQHSLSCCHIYVTN